MSETTREPDARQLATEARDRVRFEEDALALSDQVYRVARHLVGSREEAEDLMQETYARAFRSWQSFTPGTNLRAWLLRILTNLNIDRGRKQQRTPDMQPLEEGDYFLYNKLEASSGGPSDEERVVERLSQNDVVAALSEVPHDFRDVVVLVDVNKGHNEAINKAYGNPTRLGLPVIVILDADGKALVTQDTGKLEDGDHHDPRKVLGFLNEWARKS